MTVIKRRVGMKHFVWGALLLLFLGQPFRPVFSVSGARDARGQSTDAWIGWAVCAKHHSLLCMSGPALPPALGPWAAASVVGPGCILCKTRGLHDSIELPERLKSCDFIF